MRRHYVDVFDFSWNTGCNKTINKRRNALLAAREEQKGRVLIELRIETSAGLTIVHFKPTCLRICCY